MAFGSGFKSPGASPKEKQATSSPKWVLGSRPPSLRNPPFQRIKPGAAANREYAKGMDQPGGFSTTGTLGSGNGPL